MKQAALFLVAAALFAQPQEPNSKPKEAEQEQLDLSRALSEAGASGIDYIRALELHLAKYPDSKQRPEIEKALAKAGMDANDRARIVKYGEKVLKAEPASDDLQLMDAVIRGLLNNDDPDAARRALVYVKMYEKALDAMRPRYAEGHMSEGQWAEQVDKGRARAIVLEARATGNIGNADEALRLARLSWDTSPNAESAREIGRWLVKLGRKSEALDYYEDAFVIEDGRATEEERAKDRKRLGEIYTSLYGSEKGLGDAILAAYDRTSAAKSARLASMKAKDPNAGANQISEFTLPSADGGEPVALSSLIGKTVVLDFWATWCAPCKIQHPMIEQIEKKYAGKDVVFLSVDSDNDRSAVAPFIKEMNWKGPIYFDAGIARLLNVSSIPTVIVLDHNGKISSRMIGFIPERFEDMLSERIEETRAN
ncbi:MAG TPA: redoxin family protein [Bryobacteraceae bacterium]|nr:redoxin family protein [Bryobacteraceae bacterium]